MNTKFPIRDGRRVSLMLPAELARRIQAEAAAEERSVNQTVIRLLEKAMRKEE